MALLAAAPSDPEHPLPGLRVWFVFFVLWMSGLAGLALAMFARGEAAQPAALVAWVLALACFYLSLCNVFLPLPTAWIILFLASPEAGLFHSPAVAVLVVAAVGTAGTIIANLNEYHVLNVLLRYGLGRRVRATRVYAWAIRWFDAAPFRTLALIGFIPIPIDAVRWLAALRQYSRVRFALAYALGRGSRYVLFATFSVFMHLSAVQILAIQIGLVILAVGGRWLWSRARRAAPPVPA